MYVHDIQTELAELYETDVNYDVRDFLITNAVYAAALTPDNAVGTNAERLLLCESNDALEMSLYLDEAIIKLLSTDDPGVSLHEGNLDAYLLAVEGVSHFHYVSWNAQYDKSVTLLELELQAEVDKYVCVAKRLAGQNISVPHDLIEQLFKRVIFDSELDTESAVRYEAANYYAGLYCASLQGRFPGHHYQQSFVNELRRFYRLTQNEKIKRILGQD